MAEESKRYREYVEQFKLLAGLSQDNATIDKLVQIYKTASELPDIGHAYAREIERPALLVLAFSVEVMNLVFKLRHADLSNLGVSKAELLTKMVNKNESDIIIREQLFKYIDIILDTVNDLAEEAKEKEESSIEIEVEPEVEDDEADVEEESGIEIEIESEEDEEPKEEDKTISADALYKLVRIYHKVDKLPKPVNEFYMSRYKDGSLEGLVSIFSHKTMDEVLLHRGSAMQDLVNSSEHWRSNIIKKMTDREFDKVNVDLIHESVDYVLQFVSDLSVQLSEEARALEEAEAEAEIELDEDIKADEKEQIEALKKSWGGKLKPVIQGIMDSYDKLYKSGYGLEIPSGILTDKGIVKSTTSGNLVFTGDRANDIEVFRALQDVTGNAFKLYAQEDDAEPNIATIAGAGGQPVNYVNMHIRFMFGHIRYCTGRLSLKRYMTEHNIVTKSESAKGKQGTVNPSDTKIIRYSDIRGWIKEVLEDYFYKAYIESDVTDDITQDNIEKTNNINELMTNSLKNVVAVVGRKNGVNTRLRICTNNPINVQTLISSLTNKLNVGTSSSVVIKQMGEYKDGVVDVNIVYNDRVYSQDSLFAYQVMDILKEQGIKPSWDNVILGKKDDGTIMTYNFKDSKNTVYAMYASSRSGKGVMTLNLLASALADGCKVMYIDAKPDMGSVLADVAWKDGLDTAVYNGRLGKGKETIESRGNCIRSEEPLASADKIPEGIFKTYEQKRDFILLVTYLRGLELLFDVAAERASNFDAMDKNDWLVAVFDECEALSSTEAVIMNALSSAEASIKSKTDANGKKINPNTDPAYQFIHNFREWGELLKAKAITCFKATFGYAKVTVFFVWQSSLYTNNGECRPSVLRDIIELASAQMVKIVGRGAMQNYASNTFGSPTSVKEGKWYDTRFSGENGGFFAIGKNVNSTAMKVFRPFNVFSDANHRDLIIENAKTAGLSEQDLIGTQLNEDGSVKKEVGFEGYVNLMLGQYGLTISEQLNIAYTYLNNFVTSNGKGSSLNDYMYNAHDFVVEGNTDVGEGLNKGLNAAGIGMEGEDSEEEIHFGDDAVDPRSFFNKNTDAEQESGLGSYADEMNRRRKLEEAAKQLKIMPTKKVATLSQELMEIYSKRIAWRVYRTIDKFNLADRVPRSPVGLNVFCILLSNLVYIECEVNQSNINQILDTFSEQGLCKDTGKQYIAIGYMKSVYEKTISYDYMPNKIELQRIQQIGINYINGDALSREQAYGGNQQFNGGGNVDYNLDEPYYDEQDSEPVHGQEQGQGQYYSESGQDYYEPYDEFNDTFDVYGNQPQQVHKVVNNPQGNSARQRDDFIDVEMEDMAYDVDFDSVEVPKQIFTQRRQSDDVSEGARIIYEAPNTSSVFYTRQDGRRGVSPKSFSDVGKMPDTMYSAVAVTEYAPYERFRRALYENKYGASYEFKQRWDAVLKAMISIFRSPGMIKNVSIFTNMISANKKCIDIQYIVNDEYDIQLLDIVDYRRMFKKIPFIKELVLDMNSFDLLLNQYNADMNTLWAIFQQHRSLDTIIVLDAGKDGKGMKLTRQNFGTPDEDLEEYMKDAKYRRDLEQMNASKNPRFNEKPAGYKNQIWANTKKYSGNAWKEAGRNMEGDKIHPFKSVFAAGTAAVIIGVGGVLSIGGGLGHMFKVVTGRE